MAVKDRAESATRDAIEKAGYELVEVIYKKEFGTMALTFIIDTDKEGGISLDDCEIVNNIIDPILDAEDPTEGEAYTLNVSSPGLDRPLTLERDYVKNKGKDVEINLYAPQNGKKKFEGVLKAWTMDSVTLDIKGEEYIFIKKAISVIKPVIKF